MAKNLKYASMPQMDVEYQAECDLRTLIEAEKIEADPKRYKAALGKRDEQMAALNSLKAEKE